MKFGRPTCHLGDTIRRRGVPLIRRCLGFVISSSSSSSPRDRKSSRFRSVTARRYTGAQLPLMPGKLSVLLDTNARRGVTSRRHSSKIIDNLSRIGGNFPSYVYAIKRGTIFPFVLSLSPLLPVSATRAHPQFLNRCIKGCSSNTIRSYPEVVTPP